MSGVTFHFMSPPELEYRSFQIILSALSIWAITAYYYYKNLFVKCNYQSSPF